MKNLLPEKLRPFSSVIYFMIILVVSHFFWKFFVIGDESNEQVTFFGWNISQPFNYMSRHIAVITHSLLDRIGYDITLNSNNVIRHNISKNAVWIVWSCTGIKQAYIFFCIIAFYRGPWLHKLWYIPVGIVLVYLFNIFRITIITIIIDKYPDQFELWHEHILKYAFYGLIFLIWALWNEKFVEKKPLS
ncbi:MAG: archaeosortase/exosortase family protein [Paludibacteraceae bacterium]|nr:archaeosortase/exosortase family protein [Paludibacteraceae bacterium]